MTTNKRPLPVTILACIYIAVGTIGFFYHFSASFQSRQDFLHGGVWVELVELVALIAGIFMLRAQNWARWLALAWIAFHVAISVFDAFPKLAIHVLFLALIAWCLFYPAARKYFRGARTQPA